MCYPFETGEFGILYQTVNLLQLNKKKYTARESNPEPIY